MIAATLCAMSTMTFGAWLRAARRSHRPPISQERLAEKTGIDRAHLSRMENDKVGLPLYETRQRIHQALGTSDDDLHAAGVSLRSDYTAAPPRQIVTAPDTNPFSPNDIRHRIVEEMKAIDMTGPDAGFWQQHFVVETWLYRDMKAGLGDELQATTELGEVASQFGPEGTIEDDVNVG